MIKITDLNKYFYRHKQNEIHVINNTSISFPDTGLVAILGESGSGKTTLMNVIGGLDNFQSGTIQIGEQVLRKYSSRKSDRIRNENIGYIFQNFLLLQNRTVLYNLLLSLSMYDISNEEKEERINYVLKSVGMMKYRKKNVNELSGGQMQRVAIARALIKSPKLILADEPTGNLDEKNTIQVMNIIKKISKTTLVILVSHEKSIANCYADYIINISDGKIASFDINTNSSLYTYKDDMNLYLKEYEKKEIRNESININFYSNNASNLSVDIVYDNGKYYLQANKDIILLNSLSEIKMKDEKRKKIDALEELSDNDYSLNALPYKKKPRLSLKEIVNLALTNLKNLRKKQFFLSLSLFVMSILTILSIQNIIIAKDIDYKGLTSSDSRIYNINVSRGAIYDTYRYRYVFSRIYDDFILENPNIEVIPTYSYSLSYYLSGFYQLKTTKYDLKGFSFMPITTLSESDLKYGRMPNNASEIVVDEWVLEKTIENSTLGNFMKNPKSFLNETLICNNRGLSFTIVGIAHSSNNSVYVNPWTLLSIYPSEITKDGHKVLSLSEFKKYGNGKYDDLTLDDDEMFIDYFSSSLLNPGDTYFLNDDNSLAFTIKDKFSIYDAPATIIIPDSAYHSVVKSIYVNTHTKINVFVENDLEKEQVSKYFSTAKKSYIYNNSEELLVEFETYSAYDDIISPYIEESNKTVASRMVLVVTILSVSLIILYFTMKSSATKNIYDIGVYRAIGISKGSIILVYAIQILITSIKTTLIGALSCFIITNIISSIAIININFAISFNVFILSTLSLIFLNVLVGIMPVILYLHLTPSQLLSKYDI